MTKRKSRLAITKITLKEYPEAKIRPCMRCRNDFVSKHNGNRLCLTCNGPTLVSGVCPATPVSEMHSGRVSAK